MITDKAWVYENSSLCNENDRVGRNKWIKNSQKPLKKKLKKKQALTEIEAKDDEKKKKKHFAFGGKKKSRHGESGYAKGEEMDREFAEAFKEEIEERKMTDAEMAEREEIVKKMKPKLQSFKDRYGDDAKSVMYATATKQAMEEVERAKGDSIEGPATGKKHKCPTHVKKEGYGYGKNISHTLSENVVDKMNIYWYDSKEVSYMMPTSEVEIVSEGYHDETNHVEEV